MVVNDSKVLPPSEYSVSFWEPAWVDRGMLLAQQEGRLQLPNENFDTGELTKPTAYRPTDETYAKLLDKVSGKPVPEALRTDILTFYADLDAPFATKKSPQAWRNVLVELDEMTALSAARVSESR
jgi:hypothetical protein